MRVPPRLALVALALVCGLAWPAAQQPPGQAQLLQEGLRALNTSGDARVALRLFEQASRGADRALTARARLYLGMALERVEPDKAAPCYQSVIRDFDDQPDVVREAKVRLAVVGKSRNGPRAGRPKTSMSRAWTATPPNAVNIGGVSRDGRIVAYQDGQGRVYFAESGTLARLGTIAPRAGGPPQWPLTPAPDGSSLAAAAPDGSLALFRNSDPAVVLLPVEAGEVVETIDWPAPDRMLVQVQHADRRASLILLSVSARSARVLARLPTVALAAVLSPDGRFVAYDAPSHARAVSRDVFVVPVEGGAPTPLVADPSDDAWPMWSPAGDVLLFLSDRTGAAGLWSVPVREGRVAGPPTILQPELGRVRHVLGLTEQGAYYYFREVGLVDVYIAPLGEDGRAGAPFRAATTFVGSNMGPSFSPDGRKLAYLAQSGVSGSAALGIRKLGENASRAVPTTMRALLLPRWSPDGRSVLVKGVDAGGAYGFHRVDPETGLSAPLLTVPPSEEGTLGTARWESQGGSFLYLRHRPDGGADVRRWVVGTGEDPVVVGFDKDSTPAWFDVSASGEIVIAVATKDASTIALHAAHGRARTLFEVQAPERVAEPVWGDAGHAVFFIRMKRPGSTEIWRMRSDGSDARPLGIAMQGLRALSVSPDGRYLAFTAGWPTREPWVLEHFLPAPAPPAPPARIDRRAP